MSIDHLPVCTEGHGALSEWVDTLHEATEIGREHEQATGGHRWFVLTRDKSAVNVGPDDVSSFMQSASNLRGLSGPVLTVSTAPPTCEGSACGTTTYRYDGRNWWRNNSPNRSARIEITNGPAGQIIDLAPGEEKFSMLAYFINPYKANYI